MGVQASKPQPKSHHNHNHNHIRTAMNAGYNATLFILQQEYIRVSRLTVVSRAASKAETRAADNK